MMTIRFPLRVVFYYERDRWIAHCLEFDLIGDGETQEAALSCLNEAIELQIGASVEHQNPDNLFQPAEGRVFKMFAQGKVIAVGELQIRVDDAFDLQELETREYVESEQPAVMA